MNPRQNELLNEIITRYTDSAQPVSSLQLAESGRFEVSPATIRNDMAVLETEGYITQTHTSSGRIPTEKGYRYFIANSLQQRQLASRQRQALEDVARTQTEYRHALKELGKVMAAMSSGVSFVSPSPDETFVTGLSNVLSQPEFSQQGQAQALAKSIDRFDEFTTDFFERTAEQLAILVGSENPLNPNCSALLIRVHAKNGEGVVGIFGPVRMDYEHNAAILRHAQHLIHDLLE